MAAGRSHEALHPDRQLGFEPRARADGLVTDSAAAQGLDAVREPTQTRAAHRVRAAAAIVRDAHDEPRAGLHDVDRHARCVGVLGDVRQRLRAQEEHRRLLGRGEAPRRHVQGNGDHRLAGELTECHGETVLGQRLRMDALREACEVGARGVEFVDELDECGGRLALAAGGGRGQPVRHLDESLFRAAAQLLAESATLLVTGLYEPAAEAATSRTRSTISVCSRTLASASRTAAATERASVSSRSAAGSWTSAATGTPPSSTTVTTRSPLAARRAVARVSPASSTHSSSTR